MLHLRAINCYRSRTWLETLRFSRGDHDTSIAWKRAYARQAEKKMNDHAETSRPVHRQTRDRELRMT